MQMEVHMTKASAAAEQDDRPSANTGRKPADKFHEGPVHVSIWENEGPKGAFRTASFELRYKNKQEQWQTSHSYGSADLKYVENAAREARTRIEAWQQENKARHDNGPRP
jgi:hypothetical protein